MKEYMLIAKEDLVQIGQYMDKIADLFPTDSIPELKVLKQQAYDSIGSVQTAGQEGLVHAKLDAILTEVTFISDKKRIADEIAGPTPEFRAPVVIPLRQIRRDVTDASRMQGGIFEDRVIGGAGDPNGELRSQGEEDFDQGVEG